MLISYKQLITVLGDWYNVVWIFSIAFALVETIAFHAWLSKSIHDPPDSYFRGIASTIRKAWFDYAALLVWFLFVCVASYPISITTHSKVTDNAGDVIFGAFQSLVISHLVLRYGFQRTVSKTYLKDLVVTFICSLALFAFFLLETIIIGISAKNVTWLLLGLAVYLFVIKSKIHIMPEALSTRKIIAVKDGLLIFVIITLAINLIPRIGGGGERVFTIFVAAVIIGILAILAEIFTLEGRMGTENIRDIVIKSGFDPEARRDIFRAIVKIWYIHFVLRDVILLLCGVILVYGIKIIKTVF